MTRIKRKITWYGPIHKNFVWFIQPGDQHVVIVQVISNQPRTFMCKSQVLRVMALLM